MQVIARLPFKVRQCLLMSPGLRLLLCLALGLLPRFLLRQLQFVVLRLAFTDITLGRQEASKCTCSTRRRIYFPVDASFSE